MARALVLGGGGITGIAWESGVLAGLAAGGVDTRNWDLVVGTSAGAFVGARLLGDGSPDPLYSSQTAGDDAADEHALGAMLGRGFVRVLRGSRRPRLRWVGLIWVANLIVMSLMRHAIRHGLRSTVTLLRTLRRGDEAGPGVVAAQIGALATTKRPSNALTRFWEEQLAPRHEWPVTRLVLTAVDTGDGSRRSFDASSHVTLAEAVAASTCLPLLLAPVTLVGRRYMDGGFASVANADIATGHDQVWIVSPLGPASLDREVAALRSSGSTVRLIRPSPAGARAIGPGIAALDPAGRAAAAQAGYADGRAAADADQASAPRPGLVRSTVSPGVRLEPRRARAAR